MTHKKIILSILKFNTSFIIHSISYLLFFYILFKYYFFNFIIIIISFWFPSPNITWEQISVMLILSTEMRENVWIKKFQNIDSILVHTILLLDWYHIKCQIWHISWMYFFVFGVLNAKNLGVNVLLVPTFWFFFSF